MIQQGKSALTFTFSKFSIAICLASILMIGSAQASILVEGAAPNKGFLYGIGYREQELQQSKSKFFKADTVG